MLIQNPDPDDREPKDLGSETTHDPKMPSRNSSMNHRKAPMNKHMQSLQAFLITHMDNLAALQTSMATGTEMQGKRSNGEQLRVKFARNSVLSISRQFLPPDKHLPLMT